MQTLFTSIESGDGDHVAKLLDEYPGLITLRNTDKEKWDELTPLHCAAKHGHLEVVKLLVDRGAEVYSNPMASYPAVIIAAWNKRQEVVDYFLNEIPEKAVGTNGLGVAVNLAARQGWHEIVRKHIEADPLSVHQRGWIGDTPLHWPSHNGYLDIVKMLLDAGADVNADEVNWIGGKSLHWASERQADVVALLLERGAQVDSRNEKKDSKFYGMTPLIMNATQKDDSSDVTQRLLDAGADINAKDAGGKTALDHAIQNDLPKIRKTLEDFGRP